MGPLSATPAGGYPGVPGMHTAWERASEPGRQLPGGCTPAKAGILFDWNNWWALELASGPSKDMDYLKTVSLYYETLYRQNIPVDILPYDAEVSGYDLIVAPMLYMTKEGVAEHLKDFVRDGGTLVTTVMSGLADETTVVFSALIREAEGPAWNLGGRNRRPASL